MADMIWKLCLVAGLQQLETNTVNCFFLHARSIMFYKHETLKHLRSVLMAS